jgi:hypothetical protein
VPFKKKALELAIVRLRPLVREFRLQWFVALTDRKPLPQPRSFGFRVVRAGFRLPTFMGVNRYLEKCRRKKVEIDDHELLRTLIPWVRKYRRDLVWAEEE